MAMVDRQEGHFIAFAQHQGGNIAVDVIKIGEPEEGGPSESLQSTTRIIGRIPEQTLADPVSEPRREFLGKTVLSLDPFAANKREVGTTRQQGIHQFGAICRIVLTVTVQGHDHCAEGLENSGADSTALTTVGKVGQDPELGNFSFQIGQDLTGSIPAQVIDEDHFIASTRKGRSDFPRQSRRRTFFIEYGDDDGNVDLISRSRFGHIT